MQPKQLGEVDSPIIQRPAIGDCPAAGSRGMLSPDEVKTVPMAEEAME
jgi:hypothetical protein